MLIRVEIPVDAPGIDQLLRQSFPTGAEADLVQKLRQDGLFVLEMVATDDKGQIIGYIGFTLVDVNGDKECQWVGLAPLAVASAYQRQGIGAKLVYDGLDSLNEFGYKAVVVVGDPNYYRRFGFTLAQQHGLTCKWSGMEAYFQVYALENGNLADYAGRVNFSSYFDDC
ncbi:N-acetyltransferase [Arsenophonus nasoniae]|uniref:Acetyltransferase (GNAT) family protein n=1 Tax=Arsenophonus nasoniae TaxID=638 RepID=A0A4P7KQE3_9GAMM|nr:N-acetyltransferase [Arsenophonus nasoniae]QBY41806.1 Acetyltransferase (GNAT) family protein [Arsenophonus nasoniae]WGL95139.1 N-acetyltransferase [Arsenophonus nasoniae]WGM01701.1 N-acetyltransferase [Arsenophonus nasoniae]WGM06035.1 N-acetyltransferase [Arsenophonus nasoniae]WGM10995.1 N-acetyltransferase [Arsenophonus nasoniae]